MEKCKQNESEARGMATTGKEIADAYPSYPAYIGLDVHKEKILVAVKRIPTRPRLIAEQQSTWQCVAAGSCAA